MSAAQFNPSEPAASPTAGRFALGVDTGGTFTDAVIFDQAVGRVLHRAKAPTTHHDLVGCVDAAMSAVLAAASTASGTASADTASGTASADTASNTASADTASGTGRGSGSGIGPDDIAVVAVSTTLATNALTEADLRPAALVAIGMSAQTLARADLPASAPVIAISGGHDASGEEVASLDADALTRALDGLDPGVEAFAVVGEFSVRNAAHEHQARDLIVARTGKPVTVSTELSSRLDSPRRAAASLLNAQLISLVAAFVDAVESASAALGLRAPLMVVRGDGSLVSAQFVKQRPIETVLSGPAASAGGAQLLAGLRGDASAVVVDMGGTTSDIAVLCDGSVVGPRRLQASRMRLARHGSDGTSPGAADGAAASGVLDESWESAVVGGHSTRTRTLPTVTVGLGGDSEVRSAPQGRRGEFVIGPRRVVPLSRAAQLSPQFGRAVSAMCERQLGTARVLAEHGRMLMAGRSRAAPVADPFAHELMQRLAASGGLVALDELPRTARWRAALTRLELAGVAMQAAFTPTDAATALGVELSADRRIAMMAAELFARQRDRYGAALAPDGQTLAQRVLDALAQQCAGAIMGAALGADGFDRAEAGAHPLVERVLACRAAALASQWPTGPDTSPTAAHGDTDGDAERVSARRAAALASQWPTGSDASPTAAHGDNDGGDGIYDDDAATGAPSDCTQASGPLWGIVPEQQPIHTHAAAHDSQTAPLHTHAAHDGTVADRPDAPAPTPPEQSVAPHPSIASPPQETPSHSPPTAAVRLDVGLSGPLIAVGAPARTYADRIAGLLGTRAVVPCHAEVAGAVGAAAAKVTVRCEVVVTAPRRGSYRVHFGDSPPTFHDLDEAQAWAVEQARRRVRIDAEAAGARDPAISEEWSVLTAPAGGRRIFVEARLRLRAAGRPDTDSPR